MESSNMLFEVYSVELLGVSLVFLVWILIHLVYVFRPLPVSGIGNKLKLLGWLNNWNMFTVPDVEENQWKYLLYWKKENTLTHGDWQKFELPPWRATFGLLNPLLFGDRVLRIIIRTIIREVRAESISKDLTNHMDQIATLIGQMVDPNPRNGCYYAKLVIMFDTPREQEIVLVSNAIDIK